MNIFSATSINKIMTCGFSWCFMQYGIKYGKKIIYNTNYYDEYTYAKFFFVLSLLTLATKILSIMGIDKSRISSILLSSFIMGVLYSHIIDTVRVYKYMHRVHV